MSKNHAVEGVDTDALMRHMEQFNVYELERLRKCFMYELEIRPEDRETIEDILAHIDSAIASREGGA